MSLTAAFNPFVSVSADVLEFVFRADQAGGPFDLAISGTAYFESPTQGSGEFREELFSFTTSVKATNAVPEGSSLVTALLGLGMLGAFATSRRGHSGNMRASQCAHE